MEANRTFGEHLRVQRPEIDWDLYLWQGSTCVWPGVRRFVGNQHQKKKKVEVVDWGKQNAWYIDDQSYAYRTLNGLYFGTFSLDIPGRKNRQLTVAPGFTICHLMDHKDDHLNRLGEVFNVAQAPAKAHYGFFTSLATMVMLPDWLPKPTDHSGKIRGLFLRRAEKLYARDGERPFPHPFKDGESNWGCDKFEWAACQPTRHIGYLLKERTKTICLELGITQPKPA